MLDTVRCMVLQQSFFGAAQGRPNRGYLRDDVDAVSILVDHPHQAANLTFNPAQPFTACLSVMVLHILKYTP